MFARFDENPAMTLQDIKETKRYGWTHTRTDVKTVYPPQTKFAGGIMIVVLQFSIIWQVVSLECVTDHYLIPQPKQMLWVLKRTVSMRWFFCASKNIC